jgi:hypothetical protein
VDVADTAKRPSYHGKYYSYTPAGGSDAAFVRSEFNGKLDGGRDYVDDASLAGRSRAVSSDSMSTVASSPMTDGVHPQRYEMKRRRRNVTANGVVSGAVVGTMVLPVIGTAVGGATVGYACNKLSKQNERRRQREWERSNYQRQARQSHVPDAEYV